MNFCSSQIVQFAYWLHNSWLVSAGLDVYGHIIVMQKAHWRYVDEAILHKRQHLLYCLWHMKELYTARLVQLAWQHSQALNLFFNDVITYSQTLQENLEP